MGAPCNRTSWGGECNTVCLCPSYGETLTEDCFTNGLAVKTEVPWQKSVSALLTYIDDLKLIYSDFAHYVNELTGDCDSCTVKGMSR